MPSTTASRGPRRLARAASFAGAAFALAVGGVGLAGEALALLVPHSGAAGFVCSVLLPTLSPHLVVLATLGGALAWVLRRRRPRLARLAGAANLVAAALPLVVLVGAIGAAHEAGGRVDPLAALALRSMQSPPDLVETYAPGPTGGISIYRATGTGPAPIIFDVHGGGWSTDSEMPATLRRFARAGWLVARPQYSLAGPGRPTADRVPDELACAYAWTAANARRLGGDPQRIAVVGDSAGGGLGVNLAYGIAAGRVSSRCGDLPTPRAVVALYPTVDPAAVAGVRLFDAGNAARDYLGGTPAQVPQAYRRADSRSWITPQAPPTLVVQGGRDHFVPPDSVRAFVASARAAGVPTRYVEVPLADHAFDTFADRSVGQQLVTSVTTAFLATTPAR